MEDIFKVIVSKEKLHEKFVLLNTFKALDPAKQIIDCIAKKLLDKDGNFIEQFQTTGFEARLWELFLFKFLQENEFEIINEFDRPDFYVKKSNVEFFIEASLSSEKDEEKYSKEFIRDSVSKNNLSIQNELIEYYVMRIGSVLFSKLNKKYWELNWVKDKPLVIAITPAHNYLARFIPDAKIVEYLYGLSYESKLTDESLILKSISKITTHKHGEKEIPSNFFSHKNTENISAIIFTNNSDIHKFNRMGYQLGFSRNEILIDRIGNCFNPVPNSIENEFSYTVKPGEYKENWSESVSIFHNPNAKHKLDKSLFKNVRQVWIDNDGNMDGFMPDFFVFNSLTGALINE